MKKALRLYRDADYAFSVVDRIAVNLELLWKDAGYFDAFSRQFSKAYNHEVLHILLSGVRNKRLVGEEKVIRRLMWERWNRSMKKAYEAEN